MKIDIIVLNYNGKDLLEAYLPSICEAAKASSNECKVHVVDNCSTDGSIELLKEKFSEVTVYISKENRVLCSYNEYAEKLNSEIVIFLNNDIKVEPDFADKLAKHFEKEDVMFVAPRLMNFDNTYNGGKSNLKFKNGAIRMAVDEEHFMDSGDTQAISTGAFRRELFLQMGGFDDLYLPGIWEDVDICFRGLKLGLKGIYEPKSLVWHDESTTFHREYGKKRKMRLAHRNMYLFFWKNITSVPMFIKHILFTFPRIILLALRGNVECMGGFFLALGKLPQALRKRRYLKDEKASRVFKDTDLIR